MLPSSGGNGNAFRIIDLVANIQYGKLQMHEDPYVIELNVRHYQAALKLPCTPQKRQQLLRLLAKTQAELSRARTPRSEEEEGQPERQGG